MKIEILQEELLKKLNVALRAVSSRTQLPILSFIKMGIKSNEITLSATDLEIGITLKVVCKTEGEGNVAIPGKLLTEFLATVSPGKVVMEVEEGKISVKAGSSKAQFLTGNVEEFPQIAEFGGVVAKVGAESLARAIESVAFASAKDSLRPVLTGVLLELGKNVKLVATDGFRLAVGSVDNSAKGEGEKTLLVPNRVISELSRIFEEGVVEVGYLEESKQVLFREGEIILVSQLIDGNFPDYQRILPKEFSTQLGASREELLSAVKTTYVFARDNSNMMRWVVGGGKIIITSQSPSRGECQAEVGVKIEGEPTEVVFNAKYVMDYLTIAGSENLWIGLGGKLSPGMIKEAESKDGFYVVMPINA